MSSWRDATGVTAASGELEDATHALSAAASGADDRYAVALDRWLSLGGADLEARTGELLAELGLPDRVLDQPTTTLSGGQAARLELAAVLLSRFDVYLFDEPTNDLDLDGLERLERFVDDVEAGMVVVSHDRAFLERTITSVLELDEHTHRATRYEGGWLAYLDEKGLARRHAEEAYGRYVGQRDDLRERARRQRAWTREGISRAVKRPRDNDKNLKAKYIASAEGRSGDAKRTDRMFVVIALALGRLRRTPLRTRDWLLLGLGLSTFSWWVLIVFGAWLFLLDRRPSLRIEKRWQFNTAQIALAMLSIAAIAVLISAIPFGLLGEPDMGLVYGRRACPVCRSHGRAAAAAVRHLRVHLVLQARDAAVGVVAVVRAAAVVAVGVEAVCE